MQAAASVAKPTLNDQQKVDPPIVHEYDVPALTTAIQQKPLDFGSVMVRTGVVKRVEVVIVVAQPVAQLE